MMLIINPLLVEVIYSLYSRIIALHYSVFFGLIGFEVIGELICSSVVKLNIEFKDIIEQRVHPYFIGSISHFKKIGKLHKKVLYNL